MRINVLPVLLTRVPIVSTFTISPVNSNNQIRTGNPVYLPGNSWVEGVDKDLTGARLPSDLPRHRSSINDNYCAQSVTGISVPVYLTGQVKASVSSVVREQDLKVTGKDCLSKTRTQFPVSYHVVSHVPFAEGRRKRKA